MYQVRISITFPDGTHGEDTATGNTRRVAIAAGNGLARQYELDDCDVVIYGPRKVA
jgi:hypothetical protein